MSLENVVKALNMAITKRNSFTTGSPNPIKDTCIVRLYTNLDYKGTESNHSWLFGSRMFEKISEKLKNVFLIIKFNTSEGLGLPVEETIFTYNNKSSLLSLNLTISSLYMKKPVKYSPQV